MAGLSDYINFNRTKYPESSANGPVSAPASFAPGQMPEHERSAEEKRELARIIWNEYRSQLLGDPPREARFFAVSNGEVSVAAASTAEVAAFTVPEGFIGKLTKMKLNVFQIPTYNNVLWSLFINNSPYVNFYNYRASEQTNVIECPPLELFTGRTVSLRATNTALGAVDVCAQLNGWTEFRSDNKTWGEFPAAGV